MLRTFAGSQEAQVTPAGTELDNDDDDDGINDVDDDDPTMTVGGTDNNGDSDSIPDTVCSANDDPGWTQPGLHGLNGDGESTRAWTSTRPR